MSTQKKTCRTMRDQRAESEIRVRDWGVGIGVPGTERRSAQMEARGDLEPKEPACGDSRENVCNPFLPPCFPTTCGSFAHSAFLASISSCPNRALVRPHLRLSIFRPFTFFLFLSGVLFFLRPYLCVYANWWCEEA